MQQVSKARWGHKLHPVGTQRKMPAIGWRIRGGAVKFLTVSIEQDFRAKMKEKASRLRYGMTSMS